MNHYTNAEEMYNSAKHSLSGGFYRPAIIQATLAIELYLKSVLERIDPNNVLGSSHDVINIAKTIQKKYPTSKDLSEAIKMSKKYFTESRYPSVLAIYTNDFAKGFIIYADLVKSYVDEDCATTLKELADKLSKKKGT